jgi:type II secretory pathway pseudopilin PulG
MKIKNYKLNIIRLKGFTLVETLIYIAILGALLAYFISFSLSISNSRSKTYVMQEVNANARIALETLAENIRAADNISEPNAGTAEGTLKLDMPDPEDDISFGLSNGELKVTIGASVSYAVISDQVEITNLIFYNLASPGEKDNVRIFLTMEYRDPESKEYQYSRSFQTSVNLRK